MNAGRQEYAWSLTIQTLQYCQHCSTTYFLLTSLVSQTDDSSETRYDNVPHCIYKSCSALTWTINSNLKKKKKRCLHSLQQSWQHKVTGCLVSQRLRDQTMENLFFYFYVFHMYEFQWQAHANCQSKSVHSSFLFLSTFRTLPAQLRGQYMSNTPSNVQSHLTQFCGWEAASDYQNRR